MSVCSAGESDVAPTEEVDVADKRGKPEEDEEEKEEDEGEKEKEEEEEEEKEPEVGEAADDDFATT